ncbi:MAG: proline dehydrogenase family protein [Propionibacteriaceae bacterium]|jgi:proline dehydrogenase|nr:proline dehydrogenase family protein [Propionibacteriaceae bacterium]
MQRSMMPGLLQPVTVRRLLAACPWARGLTKRLVTGPNWSDVAPVVDALVGRGLSVRVVWLQVDSRSTDQARWCRDQYVAVIDQIAARQLADTVDLEINLATIGLLVRDGERETVDNARQLAARARELGVRLTCNTSHPWLAGKTLRIIDQIRQDFPEVGYVLEAALKRSESDCLASADARVALRKGMDHRRPGQALFASRHDVDLSYVRCLRLLMEGSGRPEVVSSDPVMLEIAQELAAHTNRGIDDFEFIMPYGIRRTEQERMADLGHRVRVSLPFGEATSDYLVKQWRIHGLLVMMRAWLSRR